jgi:hypothetical protein
MLEVRVSCAPGGPTVAVDIDAVYTDVPRNATTSLRYRLRGKALNARFDAPRSILSAGKRDAEGTMPSTGSFAVIRPALRCTRSTVGSTAENALRLR